ncbi:MAG: hypothetical protein JW704_12225 [Anaerolineaceae bacterium]|nr:hypothetical protein [Anaerolineaceae bacterium]
MRKQCKPEIIKVIFIVAFLLVLGVILIALISGKLTGIQPHGTQLTVTPTAMSQGTPEAQIVEHEQDVTVGIILAGVMLILVILFGTLFATRGPQKPPPAR